MADGPQNMVLVMLRDLRAKQDEHAAAFAQIEMRLDDVEKQPDVYRRIVTFAPSTRPDVKGAAPGGMRR